MPNPTHRARLVGLAEDNNKTISRQDPAVQLLMDAVNADEVTMGAVVMELRPLQEYGIAVTPELMVRAIERAKKRFGPPPKAIPRQVLPRRRVIGGRFHGIEYLGGEVVYYMRIGNRVKIGTTGNLGLRLRTINPEELMATEPGGPAQERHRHAEFRALRTSGEWFRLESPLIEHIAKLRAQQ